MKSQLLLAVISRKTISVECVHSSVTLSLLSACEGLLSAPPCCLGATKEHPKKEPCEPSIPKTTFPTRELWASDHRQRARHTAGAQTSTSGTWDLGQVSQRSHASVVSSAEGDTGSLGSGMSRCRCSSRWLAYRGTHGHFCSMKVTIKLIDVASRGRWEAAHNEALAGLQICIWYFSPSPKSTGSEKLVQLNAAELAPAHFPPSILPPPPQDNHYWTH